MGDVLNELEPREVFRYFQILSDIPRGSSHEEQVSNWFVQFAKERGLEVWQDPDYYNVLIKKPGTPGYENSPTVIFHGHMDMVCKKVDGVEHDFRKDPLDLYLEDGYVRARGTTLGADNGIGIAYFLALLDSDDIPHPPIEAAFTVMEELGKVGGDHFDVSRLSGKRMIDLNWHKDDHLLAGCSGDVSAEYIVPLQWEKKPANEKMLDLSISKLYGGHCEFDIVLDRANAIKLAGRYLNNILQVCDVKIASITGGVQNNVIPSEAEIVMSVKPEDVEKVQTVVTATTAEIKAEYQLTDPNIEVELTETAGEYEKVFSAETAGIVARSILLIPNGVISMNAKIKGNAECSNNIGLMTTGEEGVTIISTITASVTTRKHEVLKQIIALAQLAGKGVIGRQIGTDAPEWNYDPDSYLLHQAIAAYKKTTGQEPFIEIMPASLELGLFQSRIEGLDIISIGTVTHGVHTPSEELEIVSVDKVWKIFKELMKNLKE